MTQKKIYEILNKHNVWLRYEEGGERADFREANLREVKLRGADLRKADFRRANLKGAYLVGTDLKGVYLKGADIEGANLNGADLRGAKNYYSFTAYDTSKRIVHCIEHEDTWMVQAGSFWGTLDELENKVLDTHKSKVYLANIALLRELKD